MKNQLSCLIQIRNNPNKFLSFLKTKSKKSQEHLTIISRLTKIIQFLKYSLMIIKTIHNLMTSRIEYWLQLEVKVVHLIKELHLEVSLLKKHQHYYQPIIQKEQLHSIHIAVTNYLMLTSYLLLCLVKYITGPIKSRSVYINKQMQFKEG